MNIRGVVCYEAGLGSLDIMLLGGFGARRTRDGRCSRGVGGTENVWGTPIINRVQFGQSKTGAQPHLLLGCDECRHSGISLSKVSRSYDGKLTHAVFLGTDLAASCLRGALPKVTPVNFLCAGIK
jgi:hypothetical protein